ncbi:HNH endonuclease, partial [Aeromonas salmonicida]
IDHVTPVSNGGGDNLGNLRPLHWKNNTARQNNRLSCQVYSDGVENVGL